MQDAHLKDFDLKQKLSADVFGDTYEASHPEVDRALAVRILPDSCAADEAFCKAFLARAASLATLKAPNTVPVFAMGQTQGHLWMATERPAGQPLSTLVATLEPGRRDRLAAQVLLRGAKALAAIHAAGMVHGSLSADTVFLALDPQGAVLSVTFTAAGIPRLRPAREDLLYLAPELLSGAPAHPGSDLYGLGMVLFEVCAGTRPLNMPRADSLEEAIMDLSMVLDMGLPKLKHLQADTPKELADIVDSLLMVDPAARPADGKALEALLARMKDTGAGRLPVAEPPAAVRPDRDNDELAEVTLALQTEHDNVKLLRRAAVLLEQRGDFTGAMDYVRRSVQRERNREKKFDLTLKLANLHREYGDDPDRCVDYYNDALDIDPSSLVALLSLENYLKGRGLYRELLLSYKMQLKRLVAAPESEKIAVLKKIAVTSITHSDDLPQAVDAYRAVVTLSPDNDDHKRELVRLLLRRDDLLDKALAIHQAMVRHNPRGAACHADLFAWYAAKERFDQAFLHAEALATLGLADAKTADFHGEMASGRPTDPARPLDIRQWHRALCHPDSQNVLGHLLATWYHHVEELVPRHLKTYGVSRGDQLDLEESLVICETITHLASVIGAPLPQVFLKRGMESRIDVALAYPPALIVPSHVFSHDSAGDLRFHVGRSLALARPEGIMALALPQETLQTLALASLHAHGFADTGAVDSGVEVYAHKLLKKLPKQNKAQHEAYAEQLRSYLSELNFGAWQRAQVYNANRAGALLCGSLPVALRLLAAYHEDEVQRQDLEADLMGFWTSPEHGELRKTLGLAVA